MVRVVRGKGLVLTLICVSVGVHSRCGEDLVGESWSLNDPRGRGEGFMWHAFAIEE